MPRRLPELRARGRAAAALAAIAALLFPSPGHAYRVFLDHDVDGDVTTFENEVVGPVTAPITIVVELDPGDAGSSVLFSVFWQCSFEFGDCATTSGNILHPELFPPDTFPFTGTQIILCLSTGCECVANHAYATSVEPGAPPGFHALITEDFTRVGRAFDCSARTAESVEFQVSCPSCDYGPGDEARTRMVLREQPTTVAPGSWGKAKGRHR